MINHMIHFLKIVDSVTFPFKIKEHIVTVVLLLSVYL